MAKPPKKPVALSELPVLTDRPDTDLPVLTEVLPEVLAGAQAAARPASAQALSEEQLALLAETLGPRVEKLLREKLTLRLANVWLEAWAEVRAELPDLIQAELEKPAPRAKK
jgi:hypothetical protein